MSVTFSFPNSPTQEVQHNFGTEVVTEIVDVWPSANFANVNARNLLSILGLEDDGYLYGSLEPSEAPAVFQRALKARNMEQLREPARIAAETHGQVMECGSSDEQVIRRLDTMLEILKFAIKHQEVLSWG